MKNIIKYIVPLVLFYVIFFIPRYNGKRYYPIDTSAAPICIGVQIPQASLDLGITGGKDYVSYICYGIPLTELKQQLIDKR